MFCPNDHFSRTWLFLLFTFIMFCLYELCLLSTLIMFCLYFFWCCSSFTKDQKASFRNNVYAFVFHFAEMFVKLCLFLFFTTDFFPAIYVTNILWNSVLHGCHLNKITISHTALVFCANMSVNVYLRNVFKSREQ